MIPITSRSCDRRSPLPVAWKPLEIGATDRTAKFVCALAVVWPDGHAEVFEGEVHGKLIWPPRGDKGFGYDPVFVAEGEQITFGEMDPDRKHAMSHRANAVKKLKAALLS